MLFSFDYKLFEKGQLLLCYVCRVLECTVKGLFVKSAVVSLDAGYYLISVCGMLLKTCLRSA